MIHSTQSDLQQFSYSDVCVAVDNGLAASRCLAYAASAIFGHWAVFSLYRTWDFKFPG